MTSNKAKKTSRQEKQPTQDQGYDNLIEHGVGLLSRFQRFSLDFLGVFLLASALLTLLALTLPELSGGTLVTLWREFILRAFGYGAFLVVVASAVTGYFVLRARSYQIKPRVETSGASSPKVPWVKIISFEIAAFSILALLAIYGGRSVENAETGIDGGFVGWGLAELVAMVLSRIGLTNDLWMAVLFGMILLVCLVYGLGLVAPLMRGLQKMSAQKPPTPTLGEPVVSVAPAGTQPGVSITGSDKKKRRPNLPPEYRKRLNTSVEQPRTFQFRRGVNTSRHSTCW